MADRQITVLFLLNEASESSIPLEVAAKLDETEINVEVCAFFDPDEDTFGVNVRSLGASSQLDPRPYLRLLRVISETDPDIVHIHSNATGSVIRVLLAMDNVKLVSTEHNSHMHFSRLKRIINGVTNPLNDVVVANSEMTKLSFSSWEQSLLSISDTTVRKIHNGVNTEAVSEGRKSGHAPSLPDGFIIGTAGRMVTQKNHAAIVRGAAPIIREQNDAHLVFVGKGELETNLQNLVEEYGIRDNTHFLGYLPKRADVYAVMDNMDIFAFPSKYEGFGVAVAEAMAVGTPVVANKIPVLEEVIGDAGILVDIDTGESLTAPLKSLYEDEGRRRHLGNAGAQRIEDYFHLGKTVHDHVALYRMLVGYVPN